MAKQNNTHEYEAMIIPKGARILSSDGGEIQLDVQGDLVLQENQQGLTALKSQQGSILIDEGVTVKARSVEARHKIRIRGTLDTDQISGDTITIEGGTITCDDMQTQTLESVDGKIETSGVRAKTVSIRGGSVEIGSIAADSLTLKDKVRGSVLISNAVKRIVDDTVQIKGGFESDVELLGYLLKYRRQVMSNRVLDELQSRKEGREFRRFLLQEQESGKEPKTIDAVAEPDLSSGEDSPPVETPVEEPAAVETASQPDSDDTADTMPEHESEESDAEELNLYGERLDEALPGEGQLSSVLRLVRNSLHQGDLKTLQAVFRSWSSTLDDEAAKYGDDVKDVLDDVRAYVNSHAND